MSLLKQLTLVFEAHANRDDAVPMAAYMKNKFDFLGIKSPVRRKLQQPFFAELKKASPGEISLFVKQLWHLPYREYQYCAADLLERHIKKMPEDYITDIRYLITHKSWWDSVDALVPRSLGTFFVIHKHLIKIHIPQWIESDSIWLKRATLIFQLKYKNNTDGKLLFDTVLRLKDTGEFFIDKAIGWALREYSKTNPEEIITFVNANNLSPLSQREAMKFINQKSQ